MIINVIRKAHNRFLYEYDQETKSESVKVKLKSQRWQNLDHLIVIPLSIHSAIYDGMSGNAKIMSLIRTVKHYAKNKILILLCEGAHLNCLSMQLQCSLDEALAICKSDASQLVERFKGEFDGCDLMFWSEFIFKNKNYHQYKSEIMGIYQTDKLFEEKLNKEAEKTNQIQMIQSLKDKQEFIEKANLDNLEMMVGIRIMHDAHYRTLIYPGSLLEPFTYLQPLFYPNLIFINADIKTKVVTSAEEEVM